MWDSSHTHTYHTINQIGASQSPHQVGATNPTSALEKFRKLDPPTFKGTKDPIEADNWLKELERLFRAMKVSDEQ